MAIPAAPTHVHVYGGLSTSALIDMPVVATGVQLFGGLISLSVNTPFQASSAQVQAALVERMLHLVQLPVIAATSLVRPVALVTPSLQLVTMPTRASTLQLLVPAASQGSFLQRTALNTGLTGAGIDLNDLTTRGPGNTTGAGQVLYRRRITGDFGIIHSNVILRECYIEGEVTVGRGYQGGDTSVSDTLIEDCEMVGNGALNGIGDITAVRTISRRNNIHGFQNVYRCWTGNNCQFLDNYGWGEQSDTGSPHFDGIEAYCWTGTLLIRGNSIHQTVGSGATAPLNITPLGSNCGSSVLTVELNLFRSANSGYVVLGDDSQGGRINAVFTNNRLWRTSGGSHWDLRNTTGNSTYSGSGNVDHVSGAAVAVP